MIARGGQCRKMAPSPAQRLLREGSLPSYLPSFLPSHLPNPSFGRTVARKGQPRKRQLGRSDPDGQAASIEASNQTGGSVRRRNRAGQRDVSAAAPTNPQPSQGAAIATPWASRTTTTSRPLPTRLSLPVSANPPIICAARFAGHVDLHWKAPASGVSRHLSPA